MPVKPFLNHIFGKETNPQILRRILEPARESAAVVGADEVTT